MRRLQQEVLPGHAAAARQSPPPLPAPIRPAAASEFRRRCRAWPLPRRPPKRRKYPVVEIVALGAAILLVARPWCGSSTA